MSEGRYLRNSYCSFCGQAFAPDQRWPRRCAHCGQTTFQNPIPVTIVLQPVDDGVLAVRRGIEPQRGALALPGGYIDLGESWQEAGARELREETGVVVDPQAIEVMRVFSAPDGTLIVCGRAPSLRSTDLPPFVPTPEATERVIVTRGEPMAWALHSELVEEYLAGLQATNT